MAGRKQQGLILPVLTGLTALGSISVSMYLPSLPKLAIDLAAPTSEIKLSLTGFLFMFAVSQTAYGPVSERFGRKPPILGGLMLYLVGSALCAVSIHARMLIAARIIQGLGAGAGPALGRAVVRDLYSGNRLTSSLATIAAAVALSPMLGPVAGGYLQTWFGWRSSFYVLFLLGFLLFLAAWRILPETKSQLSTDALRFCSILHGYSRLLGDSEYVSSLLCGGLLTAGNFAWTAAAPFLFARKFGFSPAQYGNTALVVGAGYVCGTFLSGRLSSRFLAPTIVYTGTALTILSSLVLFSLAQTRDGFVAILAGMFMFTFGMGIVIPMSAACALSLHPEIAGFAAGLLGTLQIFTGALGTFAAGFFPAAKLSPIALLLLFSSIAATICAYIALKPFRNRVVSAAVAHA